MSCQFRPLTRTTTSQSIILTLRRRARTITTTTSCSLQPHLRSSRLITIASQSRVSFLFSPPTREQHKAAMSSTTSPPSPKPTPEENPPNKKGKRQKQQKTKPKPSASILLLSPKNQVLLLHRVQTSTSFASAHVFPGGNLSGFHDGGDLASLESDVEGIAHRDGPAYRLAAVRETFEESGILLARGKSLGGDGESKGGDGGKGEGQLLDVSEEVKEVGRREVHSNRVRFGEWLSGVGGVADLDGLVPFTRWITPAAMPKRFSTQMYLYMLPLSSGSPSRPAEEHTIVHTPTHDGGLEHTAATFDDAGAWLARARTGEILLFPPQFYLLHLVAQFLSGAPPSGLSHAEARSHYQTQRAALLRFIREPQMPRSQSKPHRTAQIPWAEKVMSPTSLFVRRRDGRVVLGLDKPGPELEGTGRGGDWDRVVLVKFRKDGPTGVEVRWREDVLREEREGEPAKL